MEWPLILLLIFGSLVILMASGFLVAIAFIVINIFGAVFLWGGEGGLNQLILSMASSVTHFSLVAIPLFVLMGEVMFHSGIAPLMMNALDKWLGHLPGRLGLLAVGGGTLFATLTASSLGSTAMLGALLTPEMEKRGYKKTMSLGPILGSGLLAMMIPPSNLAILLSVIGEISVGKILIAIIIPGLLLATIFGAYIVIRCWLQPSIAPSYALPTVPWSEKLVDTVKYILPTGLVVFLVIGLMLLGVTTPSEAAASGVLGIFILALFNKRLNWEVIKKSAAGTLQITVMILIILVGVSAFSQILAYSGASKGLAEFIIGLPLPPISIIVAMQVVLLFLGMFIDVISIMMITLPLFVPLVELLGFNTVWFGVVFLLNMELAQISPPFGLNLFVMKGVAPPDTTMGDIYKAAIPFVGCGLAALVLVMVFRDLALWLPRLMG